jgi:ABC-2 type transport system permease protein
LVADTLRSRRLATLVWIASGVAFMVVVAYGYIEEVETNPGGAAGMGAAIEAAAQAMRLLRWPAERLDTFGGYITYHNVTVLALALGVWGAIQGASLVRGARAEGQLEHVLATGCPRWRVLAGRVAGFVITLLVIVSGIGGGLAAATAVAGVYDLSGSMITMVFVGLAALSCFGLGLALTQMVGTARFAAGLASAIITGLYLLTNLWEELGWMGGLRYLSPFYYSNQARALVPGHSTDLSTMAVLTVMTAGAVGFAARAFEKRDLGSPLWTRKRREARAAPPYKTGAIRSYWWVESSRNKVSLVAWSLGAATLTGLMAWLEPVVVDMWDEMGFSQLLSPAGSRLSATDQYLSFASQLVVAVVAGYTVTQCASWVAEMRDGRVELYLAHPVTWQRLVLERLAVVSTGVAVMSIAAAGGLAVGATAVAAPLNLAGLLRTIPLTFLLGLSIAGLGSLLVAWLPSGTSVILLAAATFASYLLAFVVPLFDLPQWLANISLFGAYGQPYLDPPEAGGMLLLTALALAGGFAAPRLAGRRPKVA